MGKKLMNEWVKKTVAAMLAGLGTWLAATGLVDAASWASVTGEPVVVAVAGIVTVVLYAVINKASDWVMDLFKGDPVG